MISVQCGVFIICLTFLAISNQDILISYSSGQILLSAFVNFAYTYSCTDVCLNKNLLCSCHKHINMAQKI